MKFLICRNVVTVVVIIVIVIVIAIVVVIVVTTTVVKVTAQHSWSRFKCAGISKTSAAVATSSPPLALGGL